MTQTGHQVLVTGAGGQLGRALARSEWPLGLRPSLMRHAQLDISDPQQVKRTLDLIQPRLILNAAAYTDVAGAEKDVASAFRVNALGPAILAQAARDRGLPLIQVSTDFVFSGSGPHAEAANPQPINVYGASKRAGELAALSGSPTSVVVRTAWVFDAVGPNFVTKLLARSDQPEVAVVEDEWGNPTSTSDLAEGLLALIDSVLLHGLPEHRLFHLINQGAASRYEMAQVIFAQWQGLGHAVPELVPVAAASLGSAVRRASDSRLQSGRLTDLTGWQARPWQVAVAQVVQSIGSGSGVGLIDKGAL